MALSLSALRTRAGILPEVLAHQSVILIDRDPQVGRTWARDLEKTGFGLVLTASTREAAMILAHQNPCDLVFVDPFVADNPEDGFALIQTVIKRHPGSSVAVITGNPSMALCRRAARLKISDFFVKGPRFSISDEAVRLTRKKLLTERPEGMLATGLFSSVGVTRGELAVIEAFADGYPKQQDIAKRLNKDEVYIRKVFSRVYKKLENYFSITNQAQLSHIVTLCSLFE